MAKARSVAEKGGFTLRQALSSVKTITPQDIDWAVSNYLDVAYVRITEKMLDPDLVRSFPAHLAYAYTCLPLFRSGNELHLVISNPFHPRPRRSSAKSCKSPRSWPKARNRKS